MIPCVKLNYLNQKSLFWYMFVVNIWQQPEVVFLAIRLSHDLQASERAKLSQPSRRIE